MKHAVKKLVILSSLQAFSADLQAITQAEKLEFGKELVIEL